MSPEYVERSQIYVLGPTQDARLGTVAPGATIDLALGLDADAPFMLRGRALRVKYDSSRRQTGLNAVRARWSYPDGNFQSQDYIRQSLLGPYFGQLGNPIPVSPQILYPRQGRIRVDFQNTGASELTNLTFYFIGVKLFKPGAVKTYLYPQTFRRLDYVYPVTSASLPVTAVGIRQTLKIKADADFVFKTLQAGLPFSTTPVNEVFVTLKDEDEKPYSNSPVHIDVLAGNANMGAMYPAGSSAGVAPVGPGPALPGCIWPEIYLPKNQLMYFDISRDDSSYGGAVAVDFPILFTGCKVFA